MKIRKAAWCYSALALSIVGLSCSRTPRDTSMTPLANSATQPKGGASGASGSALDSGANAAAIASPSPKLEERTLHFEWKPDRAKPAEYEMSSVEDQHTVWLLRGVHAGGTYPLVVALHGQPHRGQAPHTYTFPSTVAGIARRLVDSGELSPFVLVTPVFRFEGQNWPYFSVASFVEHVKQTLATEGITPGQVYVVGHSGAAGCGGDGLNNVVQASPAAVGFFDTCVGEGFVQSARLLTKHGIPTLVVHSVETAGFQPRTRTEYDPNFDFGKVYRKIGLTPSACPPLLPEAKLRKLEYQCATDARGITQALVIDTGEGQKAHDAVVPVAFPYFLRRYVKAAH